jgi:hypothetical protein
LIENNTTQWQAVPIMMANGAENDAVGNEPIDELLIDPAEADWWESPNLRRADAEQATIVHRLVPTAGRRDEWTLEWDRSSLRLIDPQGYLVFEAPPHRAGWHIDFRKLFAADAICFRAGTLELMEASRAEPIAVVRNARPVRFQANQAAMRDFARLAVDGPCGDVMRADFVFRTKFGAAMLTGAGGLFALLLSIVIGVAPFWQMFRFWLVAFVLLAVAGVGFYILLDGISVLRRIRRVEEVIASELSIGKMGPV